MLPFKDLVDHLKDNREKFLKSYEVMIREFDPTEGNCVRSTNIEIVDFDALLREIDAFTEEFFNAPR